MKSYKKKFAAAGLTLALLTGAQAISGAAPVLAAEASMSASKQFQSDMNMLNKQNRRDYLYVLNINGPMGKSTLEGLFAYQSSPKVNVMGSTKITLNGQVNNAPFYLEETANGLISYTKDRDGKWIKTSPKDKIDFSLLKNDLQLTLASQLLQSQKKVDILSRASDKNVYKVIVNGGEFLAALPQQNILPVTDASGSDLKLNKDILQQIGDVSLLIVVDPVHHEIAAVKGDFSQPIKNGVNAIIRSGKIAKAQADSLKTMADGLTVQFEATTIKPEITGSIAVPSDIQKTAAEKNKQ